jgi:hypothetical protein
VVLSNGDQLHGEVKTLDQSVLTIETPYSDSDFKVEWEDVEQIISTRHFLVFLNTREKLDASFNTSGKKGHTILTFDEQFIREVPLNDIVIINVIEDDFESRFNASVSAGFSITKANDTRQLSVRANAGYNTKDWRFALTFNDVSSEQSETDPVRSTDGSFNISYLFYKNWFGSLKNEFYSNSEQSLNLRMINTFAIGNLLIRTNKMYLSGSAGLSNNREDYDDKADIVKSAEGFLGGEFNAYDIGDLNFLTKLSYFPSLTETERYRIDFNADLKYDFPKDIFIKLGYTLNFDSNPPNGGPKDNFTFQTTIGWEF